jgi:uncharacterized DUF497 family protein
MHFLVILWDMDDDPKGNVQHILHRHGLTKEDFEEVLLQARFVSASKNSASTTAVGVLPDGRVVRILFEQIDADTIYPITAFEPGPAE